ncbi:MAG: MarR family transcriptional regulator [Chloroflexota bacterium]|nr:MarR family transcriptional regulator [Chloroflexota bacterium]
MIDDRVQLINRILDCSGSLYHNLNSSRDRAWLSVDLTMPQLKALMCVAHNNGAPSGQIARRLGVGLSTITGIVDRLAEQDLVTRHEDPEDRRITRVRPTPRGRALVDELMQYRNEIISVLLSQLDAAQLKVVETALTYLADAAAQLASKSQKEEAVA